MRGDLHHLFACESRCNSFRNNFPYTDLPNYPADESEKLRSDCGNTVSGFFEPERNKGVVARAVLYFMVRYPGAIAVYDDSAIQVLKSWAAEQPISLYEKHRNREIYLLQGNRNPFIDYPEILQTLEIKV